MDDDNPWDLLGRGSSAGRALFSLYSGDLAGRQAGNKYSQRNREKFIKQLQTVNRAFEEQKLEKPKAIPKSQVRVTVPKFNKKKSSVKSSGYGQAPVGKKPAHQIKKELKVLEEDLRHEKPRPRRELIGDQEKTRYATLLEWNGKPPPEITSDDYVPKKMRGRRTEKEELRDLFDATVREIDERKAFLEEMKAAGKGPAMLQQIKTEITTRIQDTRRIDKLMQELE
jgi:hypothetical protein